MAKNNIIISFVEQPHEQMDDSLGFSRPVDNISTHEDLGLRIERFSILNIHVVFQQNIIIIYLNSEILP